MLDLCKAIEVLESCSRCVSTGCEHCAGGLISVQPEWPEGQGGLAWMAGAQDLHQLLARLQVCITIMDGEAERCRREGLSASAMVAAGRRSALAEVAGALDQVLGRHKFGTDARPHEAIHRPRRGRTKAP